MKVRIPLGALALAFLAPWSPAQQDTRVENLAGGPSCGSATIPRMFTPGNFAAALEQAKEQQRPLLVKGVAFGMDRLGATDPTKGHW